MWVMYAMLAIVVIILITRAAIKLKFGFWGAQPVFHVYDLQYWICPPGVISKELPSVNKYVNHVNATTRDFTDMSPVQKSKFCRFIQSYYLRGGNAKYLPTETQITTPFTNNAHPSYLTTYGSTRALYDEDGSTIVDDELIAVISARPLTVTLKKERFPVYYVDNLCVHPDYRKKGIAPRLIQTHHYDTRHKTPKVEVHLFKREGELTAIVPLVAYFTYMYVLPKLKKTPLSGQVTLIQVGDASLQDALEFIHSRCADYSATIVTGISTLTASIANGCISIYMLVSVGKVLGLYVLRDPSVTHGDDKALECSASIKGCEEDLFILGFWEAVRRANKTLGAKSLLVEGLGDNILLNNRASRTASLRLLGRSPTAYFFYNYACRSILPDGVFALV